MTDGVLLTDEGRDRRIKCVRRWLEYVRACESTKASRIAAVNAAHDEYDRLQGIRFDRQGGRSKMLNGDDGIAAFLSRMEELEQEMVEYSEEYSSVVSNARHVLHQMCDPIGECILEGHYIQRHTWAYVADSVGYSEMQTRRIACGAMLECYETMPHEFREKVPRADW